LRSAGRTALEKYRWEHRLMLAFAPDVDSTLHLWQQEVLLGAKPGLNERDIVVISVLGAVVEVGGKPDAAASSVELRDAFNVSPHDFRVVLIGRDSGVKLRQDEPILAADLFALIDSMPMRKQEMGRRPG
jgi:Domain of unknown function (DUF4174)